MAARAARARRAHFRHMARAAHRGHRKHRHGKRGRRLMMRSFAAGQTPTNVALGQSLPGSLIAVARPGSGSLVPTAASSRATGALSGSGSGSAQVGVLAAQVRAAATTTGATATGARAHAAAKRGHGGGGSHASDTTFLLPIGVPGPIEHFVSVVPEALWIALASALALAGVGAVAAIRSGRRVRRQAGEYAAVAAVALTDQLTGVLNRRGFTDEVERELARARRYDAPFVLAYADVRGLKTVNDSEGHLAGDAVIREVAHLLNESVRAEDAVGRLGGDELALLLTGQSASGADAVVERIRAHVPGCRDALGLRTEWDVTIGTASYPADGGSFDELVSTADRRLYEQRGIRLR
jgi:diguanylate cyclase (GGDEF)-like protein